jgi:hypothetical protein
MKILSEEKNYSSSCPALPLQRLCSLLSAVLVVSLANASIAAPTVSFETVVLTGQDALGPNTDARFAGLTPLHLGDGGHVAFRGSMNGTAIPETEHSGGIWAGLPGDFRNVMRGGVILPGVDGKYYGGHAITNSQGDVAIAANLDPSVGYHRDHVLWTGTPDSLQVIARESDHAPGTPPATVFGNGNRLWTESTFQIIDFDENSRITFESIFVEQGQSFPYGIWSGTPGDVQLIARTGSQAPGLPSGIAYQRVRSYEMSGDNYAFSAWLQGPKVNPLTDVAIWTGRSDSERLVVREGDFIPGSRTVAFGMLMSDAQLNDQGDVLFQAQLVGQGIRPSNDFSFWLSGPTEPRLLFQEGMAIPSFPNLRFTDLSVQPGPDDQYVVMARFSGEGVMDTNNSAIFVGTPDGLRMIAREGMQAPGAEAGVLFGDMIFVRTPFTPSGQLAFSNILTGAGVSPTNDGAYYIADTDGVPYLVVREGNLLDIGNGQSKRVSFLNELGVTEGTFNSQGELFFEARFSDGEGLFLSELVPQPPMEPPIGAEVGKLVPEPSSYLLAATAVGLMVVVVLSRRKVLCS